ncbi:MAG: hypothetical protein NZ704_12535, partial [Geminicoccaceae bacterium]|nr:hypothetical protein [Geminicoccaceae bacterium]
ESADSGFWTDTGARPGLAEAAPHEFEQMVDEMDVGSGLETPSTDIELVCRQRALDAIRRDPRFISRLRKEGAWWLDIQKKIYANLKDTIHGEWDKAFELVPWVLTQLFGPQNDGWRTEKRIDTHGDPKAYVIITAIKK